MSQPMKQTTLSFNARSKRRRASDNQDDGTPPQRTAPVALGRIPAFPTSRPNEGAVSHSEPSQNNPITASLGSPGEIQSTDRPSNPDMHLSKDATLSFSSCQLPSSSSSQRIVRDGERMVTNSDEDDDSSELEDLDGLIRRTEREDSKKLPEGADKLSSERSENPRRISGRPKSGYNPSPVMTGAEYKYSLASLAEQRQLLQSSEKDVARVNAMLEARRQTQSVTGQSPIINNHPKENVIDAVMNERGGEDAGRLKDALRRTEALHRDKIWSFFHAGTEAEIDEPFNFPQLRDSELRLLLQNSSSRQQAFLNGFVEDYAAKKNLPDELVLWIMESMCLEKREDLRLSFVHVLKEVSLRDEQFLSPQSIDSLFRRVGASDEALDIQKQISPSFTASKDAENVIKNHLKPILGLIHALAGTFRPDSTTYAICILCRLLLDHLVVDNCSVVTAIDETLANLLESVPDLLYAQVLQNVLPTLYGSVDDPVLLLQLVRNLPVYTYRTAVLRQRLALALFFQDTDYLKKLEGDPIVVLDAIAAYVQTPRFAIGKQTDYAQLTASMALLDIGIDTGMSVTQFSSHKGEHRFDSAVDLISRHLKSLSAQIVGTSALNMRRTEAKEMLDAIQRRLSYTVRTRPPPKNSILVDPAAGHEAERERMTNYLDDIKSKGFGGSPIDVTSTYEKNIPIHE